MKSHQAAKRKTFIYLCIICILILVSPASIAKAASAEIGFVVQETGSMVGDLITVYLTIDADATIGDFEGYVSYDPDVLEYKTGASCIAGGDGTLKISDIYASSTTGTRKYIMKFEALKPETTEVKVSGQPQVFEYETGLAMSASSTSVTITVNATAEASTNAALESLKISPGTLSPVFSSNVLEYTTSVESSVDELLVSAITQDTTATVTISGNRSLTDGTNSVHVYVTAEAGNVSDYVIYVYKEALVPVTEAPVEEVTPTPEVTPEIGTIGVIQVTDEQDILTISGGFSYTVVNELGSLVIPEGFQKTKVIISGIQITAYAPESAQSSDFLLLVLKREEEEPAFYRYDRVEKTIQRFQAEDIILHSEETTSDTIIDQINAEDYDRNVTKLGFVIAALSASTLLLLLGLIHFYMKAKGIKEDELD